MSDPRRPDGYDPNRPQWSQPTEQLGSQYPPVDPAYGATTATPGTSPGHAANPTHPELPPYWTQTQYQPPPPPPDEPPPGPPKSPRWLWVLAGGAVTLVVGLVIALVIANGSTRDDTAVAPLPPMPEPSTTVPLPTTTRTTAPTPTTTTSPGRRRRPPRRRRLDHRRPPPTRPPPRPSSTTSPVRAARSASPTSTPAGCCRWSSTSSCRGAREVSPVPVDGQGGQRDRDQRGPRSQLQYQPQRHSDAVQRSGTGLTICSSVGN